MVRVGHISTYTFGGAATAARRLHDGLVRAGVESRFWHGSDKANQVDDPRFAELPTIPRVTNPLLKPIFKHWDKLARRRARKDWRKHLEQRPEGFEVFSPSQLFKESYANLSKMNCDLVHLHWVAFLVDYPSFFASLPARMPIVWTLHDQAPFTGGCHYASGCDRFRSGCGQCPQVAQSCEDDASKYGWDIKRKALRGHKVHVITPSHWLGKVAQQSPMWPSATQFSVIPYGLDLDIHRPVDRQLVRREFGIGSNEFTFVFGAEDIANRRKGMPHLAKALEKLEPQSNWHALVFGDGQLPALPSWLQVHRLGYVRDDQRKVACLSAGDVFVLPSLEDNQPQTGLEALACGTPVVAFDSGGIPEYVKEGETGWLAAVGNVVDLAKQLKTAADSKDYRESLRSRSRKYMEREFPLDLQATRMLDLYRELLGQNTQRKAA